MTNLNSKFKILLFFLFICVKSYADNNADSIDLVTIGSSDAKVKIKIFSSLTCPHCANFHIKVIPKIKKEYVDSGKVQLIFIDFPLDLASLNASKLLHCLDKKKQIIFLDTVYEKQNEWTVGSNIEEINNNLKKIVKDLGIKSSYFNKCLNNQIITDKILNGRIEGNKDYSINSTPTIVINEKKFKGETNFKNIKKRIEKLI